MASSLYTPLAASDSPPRNALICDCFWRFHDLPKSKAIAAMTFCGYEADEIGGRLVARFRCSWAHPVLDMKIDYCLASALSSSFPEGLPYCAPSPRKVGNRRRNKGLKTNSSPNHFFYSLEIEPGLFLKYPKTPLHRKRYS